MKPGPAARALATQVDAAASGGLGVAGGVALTLVSMASIDLASSAIHATRAFQWKGATLTSLFMRMFSAKGLMYAVSSASFFQAGDRESGLRARQVQIALHAALHVDSEHRGRAQLVPEIVAEVRHRDALTLNVARFGIAGVDRHLARRARLGGVIEYVARHVEWRDLGGGPMRDVVGCGLGRTRYREGVPWGRCGDDWAGSACRSARNCPRNPGRPAVPRSPLRRRSLARGRSRA